jgi:putative FmdB family regulatory protein
MPIYEYRCDACGTGHEALRKVSDPALTLCPSCGEEQLRKLVSAAGFRLAGSGWYETDFKSSDRKRNLAGDADSKSDATAESKTESKTETKTETQSTTDSNSGSNSGAKSDKKSKPADNGGKSGAAA